VPPAAGLRLRRLIAARSRARFVAFSSKQALRGKLSRRPWVKCTTSHDIGLRVDLQDFRKSVRRDDYQSHKYWLVGVPLGVLAAILFESPYGIILTGVSLIASGTAAIRGRKSAVRGIGITSPVASLGLSWSTRRLEEMTPLERVHHAYLTGGFIVLMGCACLGACAYYGWTRFRAH